jgi:hypothetical protein
VLRVKPGKKPFRKFGQFRNHVIANNRFIERKIGRRVSWRWSKQPAVFFSDPKGQLYDLSQHFLADKGDRLPEIVCRVGGDFQFRTRFYKNGPNTEYEVLIEPDGQ